MGQKISVHDTNSLTFRFTFYLEMILKALANTVQDIGIKCCQGKAMASFLSLEQLKTNSLWGWPNSKLCNQFHPGI